MSSIFHFKQFSVDQNNCAMKINTDGVLLGSSATLPWAKRILDIGTGTGVIALMLAQSHAEGHVDAVEIDEDAARTAGGNFQTSAFSDRLRLYTGDFANMRPEAPYDLIVSNPPFYTNSLHNPDGRKRLARHTDSSFFESLLGFVDRYLADNGLFRLIIPTALADEEIAPMLPNHGLFLQAEMNISSFPGGEIIRKIYEIGKEPKPLQQQDFAIYVEKGIYSEAYKNLLKPYFLAY